jgi:hypothetical protein
MRSHSPENVGFRNLGMTIVVKTEAARNRALITLLKVGLMVQAGSVTQ